MKDHHYFDAYARHKQMLPQGYVDTPEGRVLLADSEKPITEGGKMFYRTAYCIQRHGVSVANSHDYEFNETGGSHSDRQTRLNEATLQARETLAELMKAGYYDDARKRTFDS